MTDQTIHQRMVSVLADLPAIGKNQFNQQQNFKFRGIDDVLNALNPLLAKHGVFYLPEVLDRIDSERTTSRGSAMYVVNLHVRYTFYGAGGDSVTASAWGEGTDMGDKATPKAMTGAMKACLFQAFAISTEEAEDPDRHTPEETTGSRSMVRKSSSNGSDAATPNQRKALWAAIKRKYPKDECEPALRDLIRTATASRTESTQEITADEASGLLRHLDQLADYQPAGASA